MRKIQLVVSTTVLLLSGILLTGCGSNTPEDVAKTFANALSSADIDKAKELSTKNTQKKIDRLIIACNKSFYDQLTDETAKAYNIMNNRKDRELNIEAQINKKMNNPDIKESLNQMKKSLTEKYGNIKKLSPEKQKIAFKEMMDKIETKYIKPIIDNDFDTMKIELEHPNEVKSILTKFFMPESMEKRNMFMSKRNIILQIVRDGNFGNIKNVTPECIAKYTQYDFIDNINFIEIKNKSADEAVVRLELIDNKDQSNKVAVNVEKIKDEWKVSQLSLNMW